MDKALYKRVINNLNRGQDIEAVIPDFTGDYFKIMYIFALSRDFVKDNILKASIDIGDLFLHTAFKLDESELLLLSSLYEYDINEDSGIFNYNFILKRLDGAINIKYFGFRKDLKVKKLWK